VEEVVTCSQEVVTCSQEVVTCSQEVHDACSCVEKKPEEKALEATA
jgi:hypothetical protein